MKDPYASGMFKENPFHSKSDIRGKLVTVLDMKANDRMLSLIVPISRCLCKYDIHELIASDEEGAGPGAVVNAISYIGFIEILQGGVVCTGDFVYWNGQCLGTIAGYDETHMPNHLNIVYHSDERITGAQLGCCLGDGITFVQNMKNRPSKQEEGKR